MRFRSTMLVAACLAGAVSLHGIAPIARASTTSQHPSAAFMPVVIEWFSVLHPRAGQRDTVFARMVNGNKPIVGARLTVQVLLGTRPLLKARGSATDRNGQAKAAFTVPGSAAGKSLKVEAVLTYKGKQYPGSNTLKVSR